MRSLLLVLLLAAPLPAQVVQVAPIPAATPVHPTLIGSLSDPASPLFRRLDAQAAALARHSAPSEFLLKARSADPLDRVVAGLLSRAVSEPQTLERLIETTQAGADAPVRRLGTLQRTDEIAALAQAAASDAEAAFLFDGARGPGAAAALIVDSVQGLEYRRGTIWHQGKKVKPLGQGGFGVVYANPAVEGQVIKMTALSFEANVFNGLSPKQVHERDAAVTRHLADRDLGPRMIGEARIGKLVVSIKERIYGPTVQRLIWDRLYGPEQHALVLDLLRRMAAAGVRVGDMNPANLMLGRTLVDPVLRAYHIDGGEIGVVRPGETEAGLRESLFHQAALFKQRVDHSVGFIETTVALSTMLEEGLRRSAEKTFWQRFKGHLRDALLNSNIPGK